MNNEAYSVGSCPPKYQGKLFLTTTDIMDIMDISEASAYRYLQDPPFKKEKIGKLIRVNAKSFWSWYAAS